MSPQQTSLMLKAMRIYGGGFVKALAEAWARADNFNEARLVQAFPDYVTQYGPGSAFYQVIEKREVA